MDKNWFDEKSTQVEPDGVTAFGILCISRYGKAFELVDMIRFCEKCALKGVEKYINELFYDSKANLCHIEYDEESAFINHAKGIIREIADTTLCQHDFDNWVGGYAGFMKRPVDW